jgi:hypothetical protein
VRDGHNGEFCFKKKRDKRMAKEWANQDRYNPSHGVPESRRPLPRGKAVPHSSSLGRKECFGRKEPCWSS